MITTLTHTGGRHYAVFGLARSGIATAKALAAGGARVACWDDGATSREAAGKEGLPLIDLTTADWSAFQSLVLAPGVPLTHPVPHWTVDKAKAAGVEIIGDIELFFRERAHICPDSPVIAITGTNGKSTTTALIAHILRAAGRDVAMGGNIGVGVLALPPPAKERVHVLELSSFQIDLTPTLNPTVGVLLNITPDHLDRHGTMENYAGIKARVVKSAETVVKFVDDVSLGDGRTFGVWSMLASCGRPMIASRIRGTPSPLVGEGRGGGGITAPSDKHCCNELALRESPHPNPPPQGGRGRLPLGVGASTVVSWEDFSVQSSGTLHGLAAATGSKLRIGFLDAEAVDIDLAGVSTLRGGHNMENAAAAFLACEWLQVAHDEIGAAMKSFPGLPHRMEQIGRVGSVLIINDSKATNADSTEKALASFAGDIHWIVGGVAKEGGIAPLAPYFGRIAKAYLIGKSSPEFAQTLDGKIAHETVGTLDAALTAAVRDTTASRAKEPIILLSPACASYDQYKSFEHRGDHFRDLAIALPGFSRS